MKKITFLFSILIFCIQFGFTQIQEAEGMMSMGSQNGFVMDIIATDKDDAEKAWMKYIRKYKGKTKKDRKTKELFTDNAEIPDISMNTIDIYARADENGEDIRFSVWFDLGGAYLSSSRHSDRMVPAKKLLSGFLTELNIEAILKRLKEEEGALKKLNKDLKDLRKSKEDYENDIVRYERKIEEAKSRIRQNVKDQEAKTTEIKKQEVKVEGVKKELNQAKSSQR